MPNPHLATPRKSHGGDGPRSDAKASEQGKWGNLNNVGFKSYRVSNAMDLAQLITLCLLWWSQTKRLFKTLHSWICRVFMPQPFVPNRWMPMLIRFCENIIFCLQMMYKVVFVNVCWIIIIHLTNKLTSIFNLMNPLFGNWGVTSTNLKRKNLMKVLTIWVKVEKCMIRILQNWVKVEQC